MFGNRWALLGAALLASLMIFWRLGELPLRNPDEGRGAEIAREMSLGGSWVTPTFNGWECMDKPGLFFKMVATSYSVFGVSEGAARVPSALFAVGILALVVGFCRREYNPLTANLALLVVSTTPLFFALARHVLLDMTLTFFVSASIFCGYLAETAERRARLWYALGALAAGVATLLKGPVGFAIPILVLVGFNIYERQQGWWKRLFHPLNFAAFGLVVIPWLLALNGAHPGYLRYAIVEETFHRYGNESFHRSGPLYYYALVIIGGLFAWSALIPCGAFAAWRARAKWSRADRFLVIWATAVIFFFSLSKSKLPHYILSAVVALGILIARFFAFALERREGEAVRVVLRATACLAIVSGAVAAFLIVNVLWPGAHVKLFHIRSREFELIVPTFVSAACLLGALAIIAMESYWRKNTRLALAAFVALPLILVTIGFGPIRNYSEASSSRELSRAIPELPAGTEIVLLECFPIGLPYYLKQNVNLVTATGTEIPSNYVKRSVHSAKEWPHSLIRPAELEDWIGRHHEGIYLIADCRSRSEIDQLVYSYNLHVTELGNGYCGAYLKCLH